MRIALCLKMTLPAFVLVCVSAAIGSGNARAQSATNVSAGGPYAAGVGVPIAFAGSATPAAGTTILSFTWAFGDGAAAMGTTAQHAYSAPGIYSVTLSVADSGGGISSATTSASINAQALPCAGAAAGITASQPCAGNVLCGSAGASLSGNGCFNPTACTTIVGPGTPLFVSCGAAARLIQVSVGGPYTGAAQQPVSMSGSGSLNPSSTCPVQPVTMNGRLVCQPTGAVIVQSAAPVSYRWNFGDGEIDFGQSVTHTYQGPGVYPVALTVNFSDGSVGSAETAATITAPLPMRSLSLAGGCNNVSLTFPDSTPVATVAAAVTGGAIISIWRQTGASTFAGWFPGSGTPSDLSSVNRLDAVFICLQNAGSLGEPGA